ncbi:hypothetical protein MLD38_028728 [Melastoma candidum]|uniref:Uncharacterized protein n=1 Tax=Melastoma candidum TaxID=119954 RepID=A0ACB9N370_9MYRT|nr:hypothetical protein MLD38_028728 [Melastoma candidum]
MTLTSVMDSKFIRFEAPKGLYATDDDFKEIYHECLSKAMEHYHLLNGFLFRGSRLCVPRSSVRKLLIREVHGGGIAGHFKVQKTFEIVHEHFYWPGINK